MALLGCLMRAIAFGFQWALAVTTVRAFLIYRHAIIVSIPCQVIYPLTEHTRTGSIGAWEESKKPSGYGFASVAAINGSRETQALSLSVVLAVRARTGTNPVRAALNALWRLVVNNFAGCGHSYSLHPYARSDDMSLDNMCGIDVCRFRLQPNRFVGYYAHTSGAPPLGSLIYRHSKCSPKETGLRPRPFSFMG